MPLGGTVPESGENSSAGGRPDAATSSGLASNDARSRAKANGCRSSLTIAKHTLPRTPICTGPKERLGRSKTTRGSSTRPASKKGTLTPCEGMEKVQNASHAASLWGA